MNESRCRVLGPQRSVAAFLLHLTLVTTSLVPSSPSPVIGGVLLWQRKAFGYLAGLGLLFQAGMLFIGLIVLLILQRFLAAAEFALVDAVVVFGLDLVCFIPFVLFARGVVSVYHRWALLLSVEGFSREFMVGVLTGGPCHGMLSCRGAVGYLMQEGE